MAIIGLCAIGSSISGDVEGFKLTSVGKIVAFLEQQGHEVVDYFDQRATHFVSLDHHKNALGRVKEKIRIENRTLLIQEPLVVQPANYRKKVHKQYGNILSLTPEAGTITLPWPQANWPVMKLNTKKRRRDSVVLVNSNKSSFLPGSEYGLRRRVIRSFLKESIHFELVGGGWDRRGVSQVKHNLIGIAFAVVNGYFPRLTEYSPPTRNHPYLKKHGRVQNKYELMAQMDFAVVIENSRTYISEKLFDAVIAGCIPLFCGPKLSEFGIPSDIAVELPDRPEAFVDAFRSLTQSQKEQLRINGAGWLAKKETIQRWSQDPALERIAQEISRCIS